MGYDVGVYCGVYIKVQRKTVDVKVPSKATCSKDHKHSVKVDYKFCPICGSGIDIEYKTKSEDKTLRPWDEPFECDNDFWVPESCSNMGNYTIWLINSHNDSSRVEVSEDYTTKITPDFINGALEDFHSRYRILLEKLNKETKGGAVVEFGVLKYWH